MCLNGPTLPVYKVIAEASDSGYEAFIESDSSLVFVKGYPDFAGTAPGEKEKRVCADKLK